MKKTKKIIHGLVLFFLIIISVFQSSGQIQESKLKVIVDQSGKDKIGPRLAYEIKEKLRSSMRYELKNDSETHICIYIISVSIKVDGRNFGSAISVIATWMPAFIDKFFYTEIFLVGADSNIKSEAEYVIAAIDQAYQRLRSDLELTTDVFKKGQLKRLEELLKEVIKKKKNK